MEKSEERNGEGQSEEESGRLPALEIGVVEVALAVAAGGFLILTYAGVDAGSGRGSTWSDVIIGSGGAIGFLGGTVASLVLMSAYYHSWERQHWYERSRRPSRVVLRVVGLAQCILYMAMLGLSIGAVLIVGREHFGL